MPASIFVGRQKSGKADATPCDILREVYIPHTTYAPPTGFKSFLINGPSSTRSLTYIITTHNERFLLPGVSWL